MSSVYHVLLTGSKRHFLACPHQNETTLASKTYSCQEVQGTRHHRSQFNREQIYNVCVTKRKRRRNVMADIVSLRALNDRLNASLHYVIEDLTDKQLGYCAPMIDERPIAAVAIHAYDSLCGFASIVAGQEWPPTPAEPPTVTELVTRLDEMYRLVDQVFSHLSSDAFTQ